MKKYLKNLADIKKILLIALIIRLVLLPLSFHSDLNNNAIWGIYAREFGLRGFYDWLNFGNYARPDYPPLAIIMFLFVRFVWQFLFNIFWFINVKIPLFPSNFIPWFETKGYLMLIKVPGVLADLGIGILLYNFISQKYSKQKAKFATKLFLFNPAIIYVSASWGQSEPIVCFFALLAIFKIQDKKYLQSFTSYFVSIMTKATMLPLAPFLFMEALKTKISLNKVFILVLAAFAYLDFIGYFFIDHQYVVWLVQSYWHKFMPGPPTLHYINLNAFNFWGLLLGLDRIKDKQLFLGISYFHWAWLIFLLIFSYIFYKYFKNVAKRNPSVALAKGDIFMSLFMTYFAAFMFMPRVHERYLYPIFVFAPILIIAKKLNIKIFYLLSFIFLLNLYHWWWFPNINFIINVLENNFTERLLSLTNIVVFIYLFKNYVKEN